MALEDADRPDGEAALQPIVWSEAFQMGDAGIDDEHRRFIDIVNRLNAAIRDHAPPGEIAAVCDALVRDAAAHFRSEEATMERAGFGGLAAHRREHQRVLARIRDAAARARTVTDRASLVDAALAIKDALLSHMFRVDVHYKTHFLAARGR